ncbi:WSC-domain-containing protein [Epithele typhae]|uniref:WSC-domain-containing protein n=1 Tax=Epithele typhae TaxID=378194 RepID=UPI002007A5B9|nr:WSC-domain-containing protein [Epithele typhae]KAH9940433.1 WSC-domain-containing protein [Epithele typhae]
MLPLCVAAFLFATTLAFDTPTIPLNWSVQYPCAVDFGARIIAGVVTTQHADNTPATCIERCDAANFTYAGVEYSNECHCGTGLKGTPQVAPTSDCNMACTGDPDLSCGGSFRIQIYKSPALPPGSWTATGCFVDTPTQAAFANPVHTTFATNLDLVSQCINFCTHIGLPFSGVEDASDCQCSTGFAAGAQHVAQQECNSTCPLPPGQGRLFCGGFQRLETFKYDF